MLTSIILKNFKSHSDTTLNLKKINILIGVNGSGKSSILHAISILKASQNARNFVNLDIPYINLGNFDDIANLGKDITIGFTGKIMYPSKRFGKGSIDYEDEIKFDNSRRIYLKTKTNFSNGLVITSKKEHGESDVIAPDSVKLNNIFSARLRPSDTLNRLFSVGNIEGKDYTSEDESEGINAKEELDRISYLPYNDLVNYNVIPVTRGLFKKHYILPDEEPPLPNLTDLDAFGVYFLNKLSFDKRIRKELSEACKRITGIELDLELARVGGLKQEAFNPIKNTSIVNEGFGSNQLLFLLYILLSTPKNAIIGIEEPEIHLHPIAQWDLAEVICEKSIAQNKQIILTTHSEHIIFAILSKISKGLLKKEDVALLYFGIDPDTKTSVVSELQVDQKGRIAGGLKGFLDASIRALNESIS